MAQLQHVHVHQAVEVRHEVLVVRKLAISRSQEGERAQLQPHTHGPLVQQAAIIRVRVQIAGQPRDQEHAHRRLAFIQCHERVHGEPYGHRRVHPGQELLIARPRPHLTVPRKEVHGHAVQHGRHAAVVVDVGVGQNQRIQRIDAERGQVRGGGAVVAGIHQDVARRDVGGIGNEDGVASAAGPGPHLQDAYGEDGRVHLPACRGRQSAEPGVGGTTGRIARRQRQEACGGEDPGGAYPHQGVAAGSRSVARNSWARSTNWRDPM